MRAPPSLVEAQAQIRALVVAPEGVTEALQSAGEDAVQRLTNLVRGDRDLGPPARLAVYAHAYFARLHGALEKDFPDLARFLGPDAFHDLVRVYLMLHPPHRPSIRDAGASLGAFLADDEVAEPFRRLLPCAADLAAFEWAQTEAFDAADAAALAAAQLAAVPPDQWAAIRLDGIPALRVLALRFPVQELDAQATTARAQALPARSTHVRVWRHEERVRWREIPPREASALAQVVRGVPFGTLCEAIAADVGHDAAAAEAVVLLSGWIADGVLRA